MSKRSPKLYLQDILDSIAKINDYVKNLSFEEFTSSQMTVDAVVRNIEIIGEAARNIPGEIKREKPDIPQTRIMDMRNKVIHEYFGVDLEILWKTIEEDLKPLESQIKEILEEIED